VREQISTQENPGLTTPRGAAIAGVMFSVLFIVSLSLVRYAIPEDPSQPGEWLTEPSRRRAVQSAVDLVPFAGIAFLWFMGVLRSRLGQLEDQFFATVFYASGLLFVAMLFVGSSIGHAILESVAAGKSDNSTYYFARRVSDTVVNLFAMKMAGVFIFSTCTIGLRTRIFPRWIAVVGYGCGLALLVVISNWRWITLVFPIWMLLLSVYIFLADLFGHRASTDRPDIRIARL